VFTDRYQATHVPSRDRCITTVLHATIPLRSLLLHNGTSLQFKLLLYLKEEKLGYDIRPTMLSVLMPVCPSNLQAMMTDLVPKLSHWKSLQPRTRQFPTVSKNSMAEGHKCICAVGATLQPPKIGALKQCIETGLRRHAPFVKTILSAQLKTIWRLCQNFRLAFRLKITIVLPELGK
jgi:hypothetical protein